MRIAAVLLAVVVTVTLAAPLRSEFLYARDDAGGNLVLRDAESRCVVIRQLLVCPLTKHSTLSYAHCHAAVGADMKFKY